jgi:ribosome-associated translation inhibitor RaiA
MEPQLQITYRGLESSETLNQLIRKETEKLAGFFSRIVSSHVLVEREPHHLRSGDPFRVHIVLAVPGKELTIDTAHGPKATVSDEENPRLRKSPDAGAAGKDPALVIREAFRRARRRLRDHVRRMKEPHRHSAG